MSSWISWARGEKGGEDASSSENTKSGGWLELGSSSPMRMASKKGGSFKDPAKEGDAESLKSPRPLAEGEDPVLQALFSFGEGLATPFLAFGSLVTVPPTLAIRLLAHFSRHLLASPVLLLPTPHILVLLHSSQKSMWGASCASCRNSASAMKSRCGRKWWTKGFSMASTI